LAFVLLLFASGAEARPSTCKVRRGDTLTSIAKRYGVKVSQLRRWNHLRKDRIQPGDKLNLQPATRLYKVKKGDTLGRIAKREGAKEKDILALNPGLRPKKIRVGQVIEVPGGDVGQPSVKKPRSPTREPDKGVACPGRLAQLPKHIGYRRVHRDAAWGTEQTLSALKRGFDHVLRHHRLAPRVEMLDLSRQDLGPVGDHRSHQEGRDVDIAYYQRKCPRQGCETQSVSATKLDVKRQWTLLRYWLKRGDVEMMFVDRGLQKALYAQAKTKGASKRQLEEWFQYPRPSGTMEGMIRHWPGHKNHVHVRFRPAKGKVRRCKKKR
jgi:LysM repeat protein